jgi:RimJ/RimL family protein N-acetyltransferase
MRGFEPILAERVLLRRLEVSEAPIVTGYRRDPRVARFQGWGVVDPGEIERDLTAMVPRSPADVPGPWFQLAIVERASDAIAGDIGVRVLSDAPDTAEIGYTVAPAFQRLGYATDAARALSGWLFGAREVSRIIATVDARNTPSLIVAERAGFVRVACYETRHGGTPTSLVTYERRR